MLEKVGNPQTDDVGELPRTPNIKGIQSEVTTARPRVTATGGAKHREERSAPQRRGSATNTPATQTPLDKYRNKSSVND